jgi:hypothetical protein
VTAAAMRIGGQDGGSLFTYPQIDLKPRTVEVLTLRELVFERALTFRAADDS